jgi:hypothetical protein
MRLPTPAMLQTLRLLGWRMRSGEYLFASLRCHRSTQRALMSRGWISFSLAKRWHLTDAGRRVLAEHTKGDDEA